jgi:hypothetical protein
MNILITGQPPTVEQHLAPVNRRAVAGPFGFRIPFLRRDGHPFHFHVVRHLMHDHRQGRIECAHRQGIETLGHRHLCASRHAGKKHADKQ